MSLADGADSFGSVTHRALAEYHTADGDVVTDPDELDPAAQALLEDYRMVQYDLTIGQRYAEEALFDLPPAGRWTLRLTPGTPAEVRTAHQPPPPGIRQPRRPVPRPDR